MAEFNYLKEKRRYLNSIGRIRDGCVGANCEICLFDKITDSSSCSGFEMNHPEKATEMIRRWSESHPVKTRKNILLERFPNAELRKDGCPEICAKQIGLVYPTKICSYDENCLECWNQHYKEDE